MTVRLMGRRARTAAAATTIAAAGAAALMALASGTAAAAPDASVPGKCVDNVNVRAEPDMSSDIVAVCERGQAVKTGETRNGFVELVDLKGWSAQEFVSVDGRAPVKPTTTRATPTRTPDESDDATAEVDGADPTAADPMADAMPTGVPGAPAPRPQPSLGSLLGS